MDLPLSRLAIAALVVIWGTTWAAIRLGLQGIPPLTGVALRFAIAGAVLVAAARLIGLRLGSDPRERWLWPMNGMLSFVISYGVIYWGEQWVPSGLAAVLFATFPLWVALLAAWLIPGERPGPLGWAGIALGFAGVAVIFSEDLALLGGEGVARASLVMLASPVACAIASVVIKRWGHGVHPVSLTAVPMLLCAAVTGIAALWFERGSVLRFDLLSVGALLYLAVFGSAVTFGLYYWLLASHSVTGLSLIAYATPVVAVLVGCGLLDEPFTARVALGSAMVVAGVFMAARRRPAAGCSPDPRSADCSPAG